MKKNIYLSTVFISIILFIGCTESYLEETPPHLITAGTLYSNLEGFENGLNGLNATVKYEYDWKSAGVTPVELQWAGTDIMVANSTSLFGGNVTRQWGDTHNSYVPEFRTNFEWYYSIINAANTIIEYAEKENIDWMGSGLSESENKNKVVAEAKLYRAWAYRHLTFRWGDVPLTLTESKGSTIRNDWMRTPVEEVRKQIISDLLFAEDYLVANPAVRGKPTKGVPQHYLAEMYLTIGKPDSALFWADKVVSNPEFVLITERYGVEMDKPGVAFMDGFKDGNSNREEGNTEALWVWQNEYGIPGSSRNQIFYIFGGRYSRATWGGIAPLQLTVERGGRGNAYNVITKWALENYEPQDDRGSQHAIRKFFILKDEEQNAPFPADRLPPGYQYGDTLWCDWSHKITTENTEGGVKFHDWPYSRKHDGAPEQHVTNRNHYDLPYLRTAETYLLKAEAQFKLGDLTGAANTINIIRRRANASDIEATDVDIDFILDERARELLLEEDRRYTLLRTGKWLERVRKYNHRGGEFAAERDTLFALPQAVIDANIGEGMRQNPGFD